MKKSIIIFSAICLMLIAYIIGVKVGRNEAIHNAYLVSDDGDTYVTATIMTTSLTMNIMSTFERRNNL